MAEGNGEVVHDSEIADVEEESMEAETTRSPDYQKLIDLKLNEKVASKLDQIYQTGM